MTIGRNAHIQTFAKVVDIIMNDSFIDRCLWQRKSSQICWDDLRFIMSDQFYMISDQ